MKLLRGCFSISNGIVSIVAQKNRRGVVCMCFFAGVFLGEDYFPEKFWVIKACFLPSDFKETHSRITIVPDLIRHPEFTFTPVNPGCRALARYCPRSLKNHSMQKNRCQMSMHDLTPCFLDLGTCDKDTYSDAKKSQ